MLGQKTKVAAGVLEVVELVVNGGVAGVFDFVDGTVYLKFVLGVLEGTRVQSNVDIVVVYQVKNAYETGETGACSDHFRSFLMIMLGR